MVDATEELHNPWRGQDFQGELMHFSEQPELPATNDPPDADHQNILAIMVQNQAEEGRTFPGEASCIIPENMLPMLDDPFHHDWPHWGAGNVRENEA